MPAKIQTKTLSLNCNTHRSVHFRNISVSDEAMVDFLEVSDGIPLTSISFHDVTLTGEGR